jgi:hypothetical protein
MTWTKKDVVEIAGGLNTSREQPSKPGTKWVAPGEGSTWTHLYLVFHGNLFAFLDSPCIRAYLASASKCGCAHHLDCHTNLLLTGAPIQPYDRQRWESGTVE